MTSKHPSRHPHEVADKYSSGASIPPAPAEKPAAEPDMSQDESQGVMQAWLDWPMQTFGLIAEWWRDAASAWMQNIPVSGIPAQPKAETLETSAEYIYSIHLPNVECEQITLAFRNGSILLDVEAPRRIRRAFSLPVYTDADAITALLQDHMLVIVIPKSEKPVTPKERVIKVEKKQQEKE